MPRPAEAHGASAPYELAPQELAQEHLFGFLQDLGAACAGGTTREQADFLRAVATVTPPGVDELYWLARVTLLRRMEDIEVFDRVFDAWFRKGPSPQQQAVEVPEEDDEETAAPNPSDEGDLAGAELGEGTGVQASQADLTARRSFAAAHPDQHHTLARLRRAWAESMPVVRARRTRPARSGPRLDGRRTGRAANRTGGEILRLSWRRRPERSRRLLLMIDVSGSMKQHSADLLRVAQSAVTTCDRVEVFTFGTRLTRVTQSLRRPDVDQALDDLGDVVSDADGGTRIGAALREFLGRSHHASLARDALIIVMSDGLERGDCVAMTEAVERLSRLGHRLVWWSPLACDPAYRPVTRGMSAVLTHLDHLGGARDLESALAEVQRLPAVEASARHGVPRPPDDATQRSRS